jgi:(p)ppGpp synthase/HD superfamily hydrolase
MIKKPESTNLGNHFARALSLAVEWHGTQTRKGVSIPYMSHLMTVSSIVMEHGGNEDEAIGALFHDALEDAPNAVEAAKREALLRAEFGDTVTEIVLGCTDGKPDDGGNKAPWKERKTAYLTAMCGKPASTLLVAGSDKLHNLTCTVRDVRREGSETLSRFGSSASELAWYYDEIGQILTERGIAMAKEYNLLLAEFKEALSCDANPET